MTIEVSKDYVVIRFHSCVLVLNNLGPEYLNLVAIERLLQKYHESSRQKD